MTLRTNSELREKYTWNPSPADYRDAVKNLELLEALKDNMTDKFVSGLNKLAELVDSSGDKALSDSEIEHFTECFNDLISDIFWDRICDAQSAKRDLETLWED